MALLLFALNLRSTKQQAYPYLNNRDSAESLWNQTVKRYSQLLVLLLIALLGTGITLYTEQTMGGATPAAACVAALPRAIATTLPMPTESRQPMSAKMEIFGGLVYRRNHGRSLRRSHGGNNRRSSDLRDRRTLPGHYGDHPQHRRIHQLIFRLILY